MSQLFQCLRSRIVIAAIAVVGLCVSADRAEAQFDYPYYADVFSDAGLDLIDIAFALESGLTDANGPNSPFFPFWDASFAFAQAGVAWTDVAIDLFSNAATVSDLQLSADYYFNGFANHYWASVYMGNLYFDFGQNGFYTYNAWLYNYIAWIYCLEAEAQIDAIAAGA